jgi:hypothetical protein
MRYGIREVCDMDFYKYDKETGMPAVTRTFRIDSAKTSTLEGASTIVYAQGGKGNARLMAWEGERTLTFTVEDALFSKESLAALLGTTPNANGEIKVTTKDFAGMYKIVATTLVRNENGDDEPATITIKKAKLQSNFNLAMSPTGDPSAFTFTFDAFPVDDEFLTIKCDYFATGATADTVSNVTIIDSNGAKYTANKTGASNVVLAHTGTAVSFGGTNIPGLSIANTELLINANAMLAASQEITLPAGSSTTWQII